MLNNATYHDAKSQIQLLIIPLKKPTNQLNSFWAKDLSISFLGGLWSWVFEPHFSLDLLKFNSLFTFPTHGIYHMKNFPTYPRGSILHTLNTL